MRIIFDRCHDPYFNLAAEEFLLTDGDLEQPVARIWQNSPAIIVGRYQNTAGEINRDFVKERGIAVVRRITGGGAVYHDLGNINYTVAQKAGTRKIDFEFFNRPIIELLAGYGIQAIFSGRNDIEIEGKKISGSAQTITQGRVLHHGTLLYSSDLAVLGQALQPKSGKFTSKGVQSVRSRVGNIAEYIKKPAPAEQFAAELADFFLRRGGGSPYSFSPADLQKIQQLAESKYRQWSWNFGHSPEFNLTRAHRYEWGEVEFRLLVKDGIIDSIKVYGDFFSPHKVEERFECLTGAPFNAEELGKRIDALNLWTVLPGLNRDELLKQLAP